MMTISHLRIARLTGLFTALCISFGSYATASDVSVKVGFEDDIKKSAQSMQITISDSREQAISDHWEDIKAVGENNICRFSKVSPGVHWLKILNQGFGVAGPGPFMGYVIPQDPMKVEVNDDNSKLVTLELRRGATIMGRVLREDGTPFSLGIVGLSPGGIGARILKDGSFVVSGVPEDSDERVMIVPPSLKEPRYGYSVYRNVVAEALKNHATVNLGDIKLSAMTGKANFVGTVSHTDGSPIKGSFSYEMICAEKSIIGFLVVIDGHFSQEFPEGIYKIGISTFEGNKTEIAAVELKRATVLEKHLIDPRSTFGLQTTRPTSGPR